MTDPEATSATITIYSLYDLRHWHERNRDAKKRVFDRVKSVLAVWEKPARRSSSRIRLTS